MTASPSPADIGQTVFFDGSGSYHDDEGSGRTIVSYEWDLDGDGDYDDGSGVTAEYIYTYEGTYFPSLLVTDDLSVTDADTIVLFIQGPVAAEPRAWSRIKAIFGW
jgi:PKD repeat protein